MKLLFVSIFLCAFAAPQDFDCDSNNPYDNNGMGVTAPQGPFMCPLGQTLDQACVDALLDDFDTCAEAARIAARVDYYHDCMDAQGEMQAVHKLFNAGYLTESQRNTIMAQVMTDWSADQQDTEDTFWDKIGDCSASFYEMINNCCSGE